MGTQIAFVALLTLPLAAQQWTPLPATKHPPIDDSKLAMAYDPVRQRLVCVAETPTAVTPFGTSAVASTWEWDGSRWLARDTGPAIDTTFGRPALAFDPSRGRVLRLDRSQVTTSFDGERWQAESAGSGNGASLCFDAARGVMVAVQHSEIYELVGGNWTLRTTLPIQNLDRRACFDPRTGTVLIFGGIGFVGPQYHDLTTWSWNGTTLTALQPANTPTGRSEHVMALDPLSNRVVVAGGFEVGPAGGELVSVWAWDGTNWLAQPDLPQPQRDAAAGEFGGRLHLFGGRSDTTARTPDLLQLGPAGVWTTLPLLAAGPVAAHDPVRGRTVSLDGTRTLEFDGSQWSNPNVGFPGAAPVLGMTFHQSLGLVVAIDSACTVWGFTGTAWTALPSSPPPPPRTTAGVAYDPVRQRTVLLGDQAELWEWDGAGWVQQPNTSLPPANYALGWDPLGQRLVAANRSAGAWPAIATVYLQDPLGWTIAGNGQLGTFVNEVRLATAPSGLWLQGVGSLPFAQSFDFTFRLVGNNLQAVVTTLDRQATAGPLVYDSNLGRLVLHDVRNRRDGVLTTTPAVATILGLGCSNQTSPRLVAANLPQLGTVATQDLLGGAANSAAFLLAELTGANIPLGNGCSQYVANPLVLAAAPTNAAGFASFVLPVPFTTALRGLVVHQQALVLAAGGPLLGFADLTAGLQLQLGD
jgi:hypothetical protein